MTMTFDLQKYSKDLGKKNKGKGSDITESIKPKLKQRVRDGMERELRLEDIINLKIDFDEECEFNNEALEEIKSNIHLLIEPEDKKCIFIQGNIAQVMQDPKSKIVRYFSRNKETKEYFYLDIIDIYMVITGNDYSQAVTELLSAYNYRTKEEERKKKNRDKYKDNITVIENMFKLKDNYPVSYKRIEEHLNILAILNKEGLNNLQGDICMFQEEAVFFASTRHIADLVELDKVDSIKICHRKVCKIINLLCLLGFIKKLKENDIPKKMLERGNQISKDKGWRRINYYIINPITPMLLDAAEEMSRRLSEGVDLGNISYNTIKKRLGEDVADKVYPNYIKTDSFKSAKKNENNTYSIKLIEPEDFLLCPPF